VPTVFENYVANIQVDNHVVEMSLWDTAGQEDYDRLRPLSYPETSVIIICFATDKPSSLTSVTNKAAEYMLEYPLTFVQWIDELVQYCEGVPRILVGCKTDVRKNVASDMVTTEQGLAIAEHIQAYKYMECSAKTGEGLKEVFEHAARASLLNKKKFRKLQKATGSGNAPLSSSQTRNKKSKACVIG